jgi:hypothetical protein
VEVAAREVVDTAAVEVATNRFCQLAEPPLVS